MFSTVIVGLILGAIFLVALRKTRRDLKENKCAGCSGSCSDKNQCDVTDIKF